MTDLVANKPRKFQGPPMRVIAQPCSANQIFAGAALIAHSGTGYPINAVPTASGKFLGFAKEWKDNRAGSPYGGVDGSTNVEIEAEGLVWLTVAHTSTYAKSDLGATVYASDSDTFTLSAGTNNILIGKIALVPENVLTLASGEILVHFQATAERSL